MSTNPNKMSESDDVDKGVTQLFLDLKRQADDQYEKALGLIGRNIDDSIENRKQVWLSVELYQQALDLPTNDSECKLLIHRELIKCN